MANNLRKIHSKCCYTWSGVFISDADQSNYQNNQNCGWNIYFKISSSIFYWSVSIIHDMFHKYTVGVELKYQEVAILYFFLQDKWLSSSPVDGYMAPIDEPSISIWESWHSQYCNKTISLSTEQRQWWVDIMTISAKDARSERVAKLV